MKMTKFFLFDRLSIIFPRPTMWLLILGGSFLGIPLCLGVIYSGIVYFAAVDIGEHPKNARDPLDQADIAATPLALRTLTLTNARNERLYAWYAKAAPALEPPTEIKTPQPNSPHSANSPNDYVLVIQHGYKSDRSQMLWQSQIFAAAGFNVLIPALRSHDMSDGEKILFGTQEADDLHLWVQLLKEKYGYTAEQIGLVGVSMGGIIILHSHVKYGDGAVLILQSSFASLQGTIETGVKYFTGLPGKIFGNPIAAVIEWRAQFRIADIQPVTWATQTQVPVMILQGGKDKTIPVSSGVELFQAFGTPQTEKVLWFAPEQGHAEFEYDFFETFQSRLPMFLHRFLLRNHP